MWRIEEDRPPRTMRNSGTVSAFFGGFVYLPDIIDNEKSGNGEHLNDRVDVVFDSVSWVPSEGLKSQGPPSWLPTIVEPAGRREVPSSPTCVPLCRKYPTLNRLC
jgi:hypothetical protein